MKTHRVQSGMAVVETMVAILVFSFGILGIVGLLAASMKHSAEAKYRTVASNLAGQLAGEMWVADKSALATAFESPDGDQYAAWRDKVRAALPGAADNAPTVAIDDSVATITVRWQAPGEAAHSHVLVARIGEGI
ncbi:type IV pilus modification PilV family protein [Noviherbaspirillum aridicola]|uniref:Type IV pilus assembly protein PilV n=1 Tax=Noviherbaspirillum aridicola TaxID=2849687 RepID=A0ABQ4PZU7_9BURK|nr:hypothetical protein [Noviherbaspirillum aridicola]GIZ50423.1 hypothetical protein NCCP691_04370 [Noviherbaspirillum aridicola]